MQSYSQNISCFENYFEAKTKSMLMEQTELFQTFIMQQSTINYHTGPTTDRSNRGECIPKEPTPNL